MPRRRTRYLAGLVVLSLGLGGCGVIVRAVDDSLQRIQAGSLTNPGRLAPLTDQEKTWADTAWHYVSNNTDPTTGLVSGQDHGNTASAGDMGNYLACLVAARELGQIDAQEFDNRLSRLLKFLSALPLSQGKLPGRLYHTGTGKMLDVTQNPGDAGWAGTDISRLLLWLQIVGDRYPQYREYAEKVAMRWNYCALLDGAGNITDSFWNGKGWQQRAEQRQGYAQYAASALSTWGFDTRAATRNQSLRTVVVFDQRLEVDDRDFRTTTLPNALVSTPYLLMGLEFGWKYPALAGDDVASRQLRQQADTLYRVQLARWQQTHVQTARTDHVVSGQNGPVYDAIFANGYAWNVVDDHNATLPDLSLVATQAVFPLWVLWNSSYTDTLISNVELLNDKNRGWFEGRYEKTGAHEEIITLATNTLVLESLLYKTSGHLYRPNAEPGVMDSATQNIFALPKHGLPQERFSCQQ